MFWRYFVFCLPQHDDLTSVLVAAGLSRRALIAALCEEAITGPFVDGGGFAEVPSPPFPWGRIFYRMQCSLQLGFHSIGFHTFLGFHFIAEVHHSFLGFHRVG